MKQKKIFILLILIGAIVGSVQLFSMNQNSKETVVEEVKVTPEVTYSLDEVKFHKTKDDCWQVISDVVYDFTPYLVDDKHPGGNAMAKDCGTDATFRYENDPEHSDYAKSLLPEYAIGHL